jgi:ankyrin repeat protein
VEKFGADIRAVNANGHTPLQFACHDGQLRTVNYLEQCGADVRAVDMDNDTALHFACARGTKSSNTW